MTGDFDYTVTIPNLSNYNYYTDTTTSNNVNWWGTYKEYVYLYQIQCPKRSCKTMNWLELDKVKECANCDSRLKAVADDADFEVKVK